MQVFTFVNKQINFFQVLLVPVLLAITEELARMREPRIHANVQQDLLVKGAVLEVRLFICEPYTN